MLYLATSPSYVAVSDALDRHDVGLMCQPGSNRPKSGWLWAADNGCFADSWDAVRWYSWLRSGLPLSGCLFATVPDVVGSHLHTLNRWGQHVDALSDLHLRYPLAFVAQDGADSETIPWSELDCLFIGGTDKFKLGPDAKSLIVEAKKRGKWVHVGRVNSQGRFLAFAALGADSADGTYLAFGPDTNLPNVLGWVRHHKTQLIMSDVEGEA